MQLGFIMGTMDTIQKTNIDGFEIGVRTNNYDPQKQTIVLIHGIGVSSNYFLPLAKTLATIYNVYALDLPGYGSTVKPPKPLNVDELAQVTGAFLQHHNLTNVTLIGHSMGCQIVARLNDIHPERIGKMILLAPTVNRKERSVFIQGMRLFQDTFYEAPKVNAIIFSDYLRMGVRRYLQTSKYMVDNHIEDSLINTSTPCLIIRGEKDHIVPHTWAWYLESLSEHNSVHEIKGAPHAFQYKFAQEVKNICQTFIEN
jgi:pimeloyl-ACP methyl ester carboxylesterase